MDGVEVANGGWIVSEQDARGVMLYVGRDGFWTKVRQAASPFKTEQEAQAAALKLKKQREAKWE